MRVPKLGTGRQEALDTLLKRTVDERTMPAVHFGATTAEDELYFNCRGERVYGEPDKGMVDDDTSRCSVA